MKIEKLFKQLGMTMLELTVVLIIMIALAGLAVPYISDTGSKAMCQATDATMQAVKESIMGSAAGAGFYADNLGLFPAVVKGGNEYSLHFLFSSRDVDATTDAWSVFTPNTATGWRGPYLMSGTSLDAAILGALHSSFGAEFDPGSPMTDAYVHVDFLLYDGADADTTATVEEAARLNHVLDGWHRPIVLQVPYDTSSGEFKPDYARLVSAGPGFGMGPGDAAIDTKIQYDASAAPYVPDAADRNDDRVLYLKYPDPKPGGNEPCM